MAKEFLVDILTPRRKVVGLRAEEAIVPAFDGERGFLPDHAHFIGALGIGVLRLRVGKEEQRSLIRSGVCEFSNNRLVIMADVLEQAGEIDAQASRQRLVELDATFSNHAEFNPEDFDALRAEQHLENSRVLVSVSQ